MNEELNGIDFMKQLEKCPICNGEMINVNDIIIDEAKGSTIIMSCENCEILVGRFT